MVNRSSFGVSWRPIIVCAGCSFFCNTFFDVRRVTFSLYTFAVHTFLYACVGFYGRPIGIGQVIILLPCGFFFYLFLFFSSPNLSRPDLMSVILAHIWCGLSANLGCRSETCCTRLAEKYRTQKITKNSTSGHHRTTLSGYIFATTEKI